MYNENIVPSDRFGVDWWRDVKRHASKVGLMVSVCHAAEQSIRDFLQYRGPIAVIPCMVADPLVNSVDPGSQSSMRNGRVVLGTAARLDAEKGHRVLLQAIFIVNKQLGEQMPEFWIAGDGPERERLEVLGRELQVCSNIRFLGYCGSDEMETFWRSIDILVLPSLWEGLPNVILEAMAHGQPVIATRVGGVPEAVLDNVTGIVVQPGNADHLAQAIIRLTVDGSLRASMGRAGRTRYEKLYRPELVVRRYLSAYESVASKER
ncbi:MAG: glycosyltransferase [Chloroflexota bacterium]